MKTSIIQHPPDSYYLRVYKWQLDVCDGNEPAAKILHLFEFHHNYRYANRILVELVERAIKKKGEALTAMKNWMPYSMQYIRECLLMTAGRVQIIDSLKLLESKQLISSNCPDEIKKCYSKGHSWFALDLANIQAASDNWTRENASMAIYGVPMSEIHDAVQSYSGINDRVLPMQVTHKVDFDKIEDAKHDDKVNALCIFHKHIHNKNGNYVYDTDRKSKVGARIKDGHPLSVCAQAVIGNLFSDWHQGRHPDRPGVIDDRIELIFRAAKNVEQHAFYAEKNGVTAEMAFSELIAVLKGNTSKYSKMAENNAKDAEIIKNHTSKGKVREELEHRYKSFASSLATFFANETTPNKVILDMCASQTSLANQGKGLTDGKMMTDALLSAVKPYNRNLSESGIEKIQEFAEDFCELQEINME